MAKARKDKGIFYTFLHFLYLIVECHNKIYKEALLNINVFFCRKRKVAI